MTNHFRKRKPGRYAKNIFTEKIKWHPQRGKIIEDQDIPSNGKGRSGYSYHAIFWWLKQPLKTLKIVLQTYGVKSVCVCARVRMHICVCMSVSETLKWESLFSLTGLTLKNTLRGEVQSWRHITTNIIVVSIVSASVDVVTGTVATIFLIHVISSFPFAVVVGGGGNSHVHNGGKVFAVISIVTAFILGNGC